MLRTSGISARKQEPPTMPMKISRHAYTRMKQRSIPQIVIDWLIDFGLFQRQGDVNIVYFNKKSKNMVKLYAGTEALSLFHRYKNVYAVMASDCDTVITVGHRTKKLKRNS